MTSCELFVIVDPTFSGDLWSLSRNAHVWIISSRPNDDAAHAIWKREAAGDSPGAGITTFQSTSAGDESLYGSLGTIDEHHPGWNAIHVVGVDLDSVSIDQVADELGLASVRLQVEPSGFMISRAT